MKEFIIRAKETHYSYWNIFAETEAEAMKKFEDGDHESDELYLEYDCTDDAIVLPEEDAKQWRTDFG